MHSNLKGKRLLVMGGTQLSCEIIRKAQEMGIFVAVADYNNVEDSPGKKIADQSFLVSTIDVDAMVDLICREKFDGIITGFVDMLLPYYAEICERTGLPAYGTKEQFEVYINKAKYKELCRKFNVPTVEEYKVELDNFDITTAGINYPVMVKPADSSGSRGITVCYCKNELKAALEKAYSYSQSNSVLVEQYLTGKEISIFWIFKDGKRVYDSPPLSEIRDYCAQQLETLWDEVRRFDNPHAYYVDLSQPLWDEKHMLLLKYGLNIK